MDAVRCAGWLRLAWALVPLLLLAAPGCGGATGTSDEEEPPGQDILAPEVNLAHLDHLGETIEQTGRTYRIVHIYSEAPDYEWVGDDDEGIACVDDAARAAVVYLRHFELTGDAASRQKAEHLLRFVMYMQTDDGRFYNFVWDNDLQINKTHANSRADAFGWWAARGVWALGTGARVLKPHDPTLAEAYARRIRRTYPHLQTLLARYGQTTQHNGHTVPQWLLYESASDATSELLLGLTALQQAYPADSLQTMIDRFAEGLARMQYGSMTDFPYGPHASWAEGWHGWGNSQTQALAEAGRTASAVYEAEHFYPRLLVNGWLHSIPFDRPGEIRTFEQIAYAVRCVAVGLLRLYGATDEERYLKMAGLAASWFTGNNVAEAVMYDAETGRGYDGISGPEAVNRNAGAESTIEALYTVLEINQYPEAARWMTATGGPATERERDGTIYTYRVFTIGSGTSQQRLALVMNQTDERLLVLEGQELDAFLDDE